MDNNPFMGKLKGDKNLGDKKNLKVTNFFER